jgi:DNA-binding Lrp family transcriptional regulator
MRYEQKAWAPLWLEFSGLPQLLASKVRGGAGWPLFKKIVELDCAANPQPGVVEIAIVDLAERTGLSPEVIRRTVATLRKLDLVLCFLPDNDEEAALFRVKVPLATPRPPSEIRQLHPELFGPEGHYFRYVDSAEADQEQQDDSEDLLLKEIVDLYLNIIGVKMNAFILDELRLIRQRFPIEMIRRTFRRAAANEIHSLGWVVRELIRQKRTLDEKKAESESDVPQV